MVDKVVGSNNPTTVVGQILSLDLEPEVGQAETTNLASTAKTYRPTLPDGGEVSLEVEYDPTDTASTGSHAFLKTIQGTPNIYNWKITYPTTPSTSDSFAAFLTKGPGRSAGGPEENLTGQVTLKITGPIT